MAAHDRTGRLRLVLATGAAALALLAVACVPPPTGPPATTSTTTTTTTVPRISIPATTLQAPSISVALPPVGVSYLGCGGTYNPPGIIINGPSVTIPAQTLTITGSSLPLPGVQTTLASGSVNVSSFTLSCLFVNVSTGVVFDYDASTATPASSINPLTGEVTIAATTLTLTGRLRFTGFGGLTVPVPPVSVTVPGFTATIPTLPER